MALSVILSKSGKTPISLQADAVEHIFSRNPVQSGIAGDPNTKLPIIMLIDVGICVEYISIVGIVNADTTPTKAELETIVREWWEVGGSNTTDVSTMAYITIGSDSYYGSIKSANFRQAGGITDRWDYSLMFVIVAKKV